MARGFETSLTEWDSELFGVGIHLRSITAKGHVLTTCLPGSSHDGTEGELYDLVEDPLQQHNLFDEPGNRALRDDLLNQLWDTQPKMVEPKAQVVAPV